MPVKPSASAIAPVPAHDDPRSLRRFEDERFLTGQGRYLDDDVVRGALHAMVLRSPHAHAAILSIDTEAARSLPGVYAVYTAADLAELGPLPCSLAVVGEAPLIVPPRLPLAHERARHVGDPVAFVVADTVDLAREASELIAVDYDILPSVTELALAAEPDAPEIWPEAPGNLALRYRLGDEATVAAAFEQAAHVVSCRVVNNRIVAAALEPRAALGRFDKASGRYRLSLSGASVHDIRR